MLAAIIDLAALDTHHVRENTMTESVICEQCGAEFHPDDSFRRSCPVCLFAQAVSEGASPGTVVATAPGGVCDAAPMIRELAPCFEQLEILELVGTGGMSFVYRARHKSLKRDVALKILPEEVAASPGGVERFQREARMLARLKHPNIVDVYDAGKVGRWYYLLMEFVDGPNLRQLIGEFPLPVDEVRKMLPMLCEALQYAHDHGVIHRDIKPENVLIDHAGQIKVVDFGLAKLLKPITAADSATGTHQLLGTPRYLAPEQIKTSQGVDHRADIYALGVLLYEALTGELPLGHFQPPSQMVGGSTCLDKVVLRSLASDPAERYQQVRDIQVDLQTSAESDRSRRWFSLHTRANELILSGGAVVAGLVGCIFVREATVALERAMVRASDVLDATVAALLLLTSFFVARINVSSAQRWRDLSPLQSICAPILAVGYALVAGVILLGPAASMLILGAVPTLMEVNGWRILGTEFNESGYWLRITGSSLLLSGGWGIILAGLARWRPDAVRLLFHPMSQSGASASALALTALTVAVLLPAGLVLICASWIVA